VLVFGLERVNIDFMAANAPLRAQALIDKISDLPPERIVEVEDFVDFIRQRDQDKGLTRAAANASAGAFAAVWDNPEDAAYDAL
jgi:hypothetical protein